MKKSSFIKATSLVVLSAFVLAGCASYRAMPLNNLVIERAPEIHDCSDIIIAAKAFNQLECKKYLDRNVLSKGYVPVQIYIENRSESNYLFSLKRISLSCARPEEVAEQVHTSTVARAAGYGAAALILWPFVIPAIVDGVKSAQANEALDMDFFAKTAKDQVITPHSYTNMLLFVPFESYQPVFNVTLLDLHSNEPLSFTVKALS